jgi:hypothetical protein
MLVPVPKTEMLSNHEDPLGGAPHLRPLPSRGILLSLEEASLRAGDFGKVSRLQR